MNNDDLIPATEWVDEFALDDSPRAALYYKEAVDTIRRIQANAFRAAAKMVEIKMLEKEISIENHKAFMRLLNNMLAKATELEAQHE